MLADILGPDLLIVVLVLVVVLFGGAAIPKLARNLGSAKTEFEKGLKSPQADNVPNPSANGSDASKSPGNAPHTPSS